MLNYIAVVRHRVRSSTGRCRSPGSSFARTGDVGNAALPILLGRNGHLGILIARRRRARRLVAPVPDDARLRDPDRRREPGRRALRRHAARAA